MMHVWVANNGKNKSYLSLQYIIVYTKIIAFGDMEVPLTLQDTTLITNPLN